jgi:phenylalanyl-tRNA synthetase beta chain
MPTITIHKRDLDRLTGRTLTPAQIEEHLPWVKGEIKESIESADELRIELNDTNRPDLWCAEGIARQIRFKLGQPHKPYAFFNGSGAAPVIAVEPGLEAVRPYIGAFIARGLAVDEPLLVQTIQTQEKLAEAFGRKRRAVSLGLYRAEAVRFPVTYTPADPDAVRFVPLGMSEEMSLREILHRHPKGIQYAAILDRQTRYPALLDANRTVLSFPPIINSRALGEVSPGDQDLLVEATGTDLPLVVLAINIFAVNLADRGAAIEPVEVQYPYRTGYGSKVRTPYDLSRPLILELQNVEQVLGEPLTAHRVGQLLKRYGYEVKPRGKRVEVRYPPYRNDLMHPVDVVEDLAISRGYGVFEPVLPSTFTPGGLSALERLSDQGREMMVGLGFQEVISPILTSRTDAVDRMGMPDLPIVEVENVMSLSYSALRPWLIPSLLRVEAAGGRCFYPHRIFEAGETASPDAAAPDGTATQLRLAALLAHPTVSFSELHSHLDLLMYYLGHSYALEPTAHRSFMEGRVGGIRVEGRDLGVIGELHPQVLENWGISMPCVAFELQLDPLVQKGKRP